MMAWYWGIILLFVGLSLGLGFGIFRIRRLLLSVTKVGGSPRPPAEIKEEIIEEMEKDETRQELVDKIKAILEKLP